MFQKYKKVALLSIFAFCISFTAQAASVLVNPPKPYVQSTIGTTGVSMYFAANLGGTTYIDQKSYDGYTYRSLNVANSNEVIWIDVYTDRTFSSTANLVATLSNSTSAGSEIPLIGAAATAETPPATCAGCQAPGTIGGTYYSAVYSPGTTLRLAFRIYDYCNSSGVVSGICSANAIPTITNGDISIPLTVTIGNATSNTARGPVVQGTTAESVSFTIHLVNTAPLLTATGNCTSMSDVDFYFPGDGEIILNPASYGATPTGSAPLLQYLLLANEGSAPVQVDATTSAFVNNAVVGVVGVNEGTARVSGFTNEHVYQAALYVENYAGILSQNCYGNANVLPQPISGVLVKSKCFIATAAYHDGDVYPVMMLRKFRDQVLAQSSAGRAFIDFYYQVSPPIAEWAWDKHWVRMIALKALTPIEILVFMFFHPILVLTLLLGVAFLVFGVRRVRAELLLLAFFLGFSYLAHAQNSFAQTPVAEESYTEKMKKRIREDDAKKGVTEESGSYSENLKKKLSQEKAPDGKPDDHGSFIEKIKKQQAKDEAASAGNKSYTDEEKAKLPQTDDDKRSVIAEIKAGKDERKKFEKKPITGALGFKLGVNPGVEAAADNGINAFTDVYGDDWKADFFFHYERQLFHDENFGSFAPTIDLGFSYVGAPGLLKYAFNGTRKSRTNFSFIQIPVLLGANYRFNLLRVLRPYVAANVGPVGITEIRNDKKKDIRDIAFVYSATGGVAILLDFLDPKSMIDSYDSIGFQHVYLTVEYTFLRTLAGSVALGRNGIYSGFLFEL